MAPASRCFPKLVCKWPLIISSGENLTKQLEEMMRADFGTKQRLSAKRFLC